MGNFDVKHSTATGPGKSGNVRASLNTDTGQGAIGRAIMGLGAEMQSSYESVRDAQEKVELSSAQRKIKESVIAAQNSVSGDEEADNELWEKAQSDILAVSSKNPRVSAEIQMYRDRHMPTAEGDFAKMHLGAKAKNVHDEFDAEGQTMLATGDLVLYQELLDRRLEAKDITTEKHKAMSESAFGDSLMQQARDLSGSDKASDQKRAIGILEDMDDIEGLNLSTEQKEYRKKLLKLTKDTEKEISDGSISGVVVQMDNLRHKTAIEKADAAQEMKQSLVDGGVVGDKLEKYFGIINEWSGGDTDPTEQYDPKIAAAVRIAVQRNPESITDDQIYSYVGFGTDGGLTSTQAEDFVGTRKRNIDDRPSMQREISGRKQGQLKSMHNAGQMNLEEYNDMADRLTAYYNKNKDFTKAEMDEYFTMLTAGSEKKSWLGRVFSLSPIYQVGKIAYYKRLASHAQKMSARAVEVSQQREVGTNVSVPGKGDWTLVTKGATPAEDVWERVE